MIGSRFILWLIFYQLDSLAQDRNILIHIYTYAGVFVCTFSFVFERVAILFLLLFMSRESAIFIFVALNKFMRICNNRNYY